MRLLFCVLINAICLWLLWLRCYPGAIDDLLFIPIGLAIVGFLVMYAWQKVCARKNRSQPPIKPYLLRLTKATKWTVLVTLLLLPTNLVQYTAFILSQPALKHLDPNCVKNCQVGFYQFEKVYDDGKGGIYLQTSSFFFRSSGFAYKPDPKWNMGLPKQSYQYYPFWGDWQRFEETHDWN
ncbi:hypothetical protein [Calothrix sp. PCC 6303]|uniref:hypothetical protein n=1 Tax=Calothrix sp. PCC 6303 TaxID=1170562 RepID=UPI0002A02967|nr:hypothetical protein [Calothrix sp. PCC 6303]AFZ01670.1 hypothetical protein Cal6303_2698 [Calothrix sp. PCC 6303]